MDIVLDDLFVDLLRVAVRREGLLDGSLLGDGQVLLRGLAVDGAAAGEDDAFHLIFRHQLQEVQERRDIVAIVHQGLLHTLADSLRSGEMDDTGDAAVLLEDTFEGLHIAAVHLFESGPLAGYLLDAVDDLSIRVGEIVHDDYFVACLLQLHRGVAADEARTSGDKNFLFHTSMLYCLNDVCLQI